VTANASIDAAPGAGALPLVLVSVLNWNTPELTMRCLRALAACDYPALRVVVVDNASSDDSVARIRAACPGVTLLQAPTNLGYAAGHALAWRDVEGTADAIWLLNSDTEPEAGALRALVDAWREHGDALYAGAPLRAAPGGGTMLHFPAKFLAPDAVPSALRRDLPQSYDDGWAHAAPRKVGALSGSCLLVPRAVIERHGWLDPAWFLYCEEIDYCWRLRARGVARWLVPQARVWHDGSGSSRTAGAADAVAYYHARNEIVLARRHAGRVVATVIAAKKLLRALALLSLHPRRATLIARGAVDGLRGRLGKSVAPEPRDARRQAVASPLWIAAMRLRFRIGLLRDRFTRLPLPIVESIGPARLHRPARPPHAIAAYVEYIATLLRESLRVTPRDVRLSLCDARPEGDTRQIDIQFEHTLVRPGGRDSDGAPIGAVPLMDGNGRYLVRVAHLPRLLRQDLVIEYSDANLANLVRGGHHASLCPKLALVAPLPHALHLAREHRPLPLVCLFGDRRQPRRAQLLDAARQRALPLRPVEGIFTTSGLERLYRSTRVLVNVHQTDDHHTAEDLRIVPALQNGVVVVSEDVPLRETLPYHPFVIWVPYDALLDTAAAVLADYDAEHRRLFGDGRAARLLDELAARNAGQIASALARLAPPLDARSPTPRGPARQFSAGAARLASRAGVE
jgi:GT2 family glycosyltransferase